MAALLACCSGAATAGVDDVWAASPATQDSQWVQQYSLPVNPGHNVTSGRVELYNGASTSVSVAVDPAVNMIYLTLDLDGRGVTQVSFDLLEAVNRGNVRLYNRGGENADRPYDALVIVSKAGNILNLRGQGVWTGAPVIYRVVGYTI